MGKRDYQKNLIIVAMVKNNVKKILSEIDTVLSQIDEREVDSLVERILGASKIVTVGAGRVGMATRGFAMRLGHLGLNAYMIGDATVPGIGEGDVLLVCSGSGETQTIFDLVEIAKKNKATIVLVTGNPESRIGKIADTVVKITAPSKTKAVEGLVSVQPMTTLNEQCLGIFFDAVVLNLMTAMRETHETMWARHSNLE
ncbi:MAG: 6-phospho-3-hexuloisomerase [Minisyncoccia bacterium]